MDDNNNNIFETGASGPQGEPVAASVIPPVTVQGIEGRIDPVAARASSLNTESGPPGNAGPAPGTAPGDAPKRGRGRPRKSETATVTETVASADKNETPRNIRASFIERMLYSIHLGVAKMTECPELKLDDDDAKELGQAIAGVLALHKVKITPAQEAYSILFEAAAKVYPPMIVSVIVRKQSEAKGNGRILKWPARVAPAPQPAQTQEPQKETLKPDGFDPRNIVMPTDT